MTATGRPDAESRPVQRYLQQQKAGQTSLRILLGVQLRRLRRESGFSLEQAAKCFDGTVNAARTKIQRLEHGDTGCQEDVLAKLLDHYGVTDAEERDDYLELASRAAVQPWWYEYNEVVEKWFRRHIDLEREAHTIRTYEVHFIPGLLQTEAYARAVTEFGYPHLPARKIERLVELRMVRQEILTHEDAPRLWCVVDEGTLRREWGGQAVLREQLEHLLRIVELPRVSIQVAPGRSPVTGNHPISLLQFTEPDLPDLVYLEQFSNAVYHHKQNHLDQYTMIMDRLSAEALDPEETPAFLEKLLAQLP
ncbi:helix-turn-helix domain-containing protein [Streptomyces malaysiensis]|uniref:XRE family transcriptional regulator n=1 Tax=Streptomyces malaysiensis TaxID=92644 RepID=A0A7X6AX57_STRMQ|nr:helix-turn-helix transcriptional regulator [Streptomyces malaysiensis]NIY65633.1 XRE family transcriptional regulator [Streptomyces malaysiensis]